MRKWRDRRVLPPLFPARQAGASASLASTALKMVRWAGNAPASPRSQRGAPAFWAAHLMVGAVRIALTIPRSQAECVATTLCSDEMVETSGFAPDSAHFQCAAFTRLAWSPKVMVLAHGSAPWSVGYRPTALLLSYARIGKWHGHMGSHHAATFWRRCRSNRPSARMVETGGSRTLDPLPAKQPLC